jgi:hypothetical protein
MDFPLFHSDGQRLVKDLAEFPVHSMNLREIKATDHLGKPYESRCY